MPALRSMRAPFTGEAATPVHEVADSGVGETGIADAVAAAATADR